MLLLRNRKQMKSDVLLNFIPAQKKRNVISLRDYCIYDFYVHTTKVPYLRKELKMKEKYVHQSYFSRAAVLRAAFRVASRP